MKKMKSSMVVTNCKFLNYLFLFCIIIIEIMYPLLSFYHVLSFIINLFLCMSMAFFWLKYNLVFEMPFIILIWYRISIIISFYGFLGTSLRAIVGVNE